MIKLSIAILCASILCLGVELIYCFVNDEISNKIGMTNIIKHTNKIVIVEYFTERCVACKQMEVVLNKIKKLHPEIAIEKVDALKHLDEARQLGINQVPTLIFKVNNQIKKVIVGLLSDDEKKEFNYLEKILTEIKNNNDI